ncbi:MAG TPA: type IV pili methyl-accepting chemotaxis transducer N-terminal domain-containing protein [Polaromonas sp.]|uniref:type IV pili methyl-accepting chemotaxis transducer N-terminal domain-containing protein n=1 Tax=Polaromonas sp. TaxID=1869339 RepID=UPI002D4D5402|nr:type IV pili methyl-accepting chemotaxis transducer N-terminal domain-containing protein [Polaromonas sp.]HYW57565.1 type IV pili methyl-accepting chemotaxis transducer N-terminal domain-containing protein [Polaromonas sp.]
MSAVLQANGAVRVAANQSRSSSRARPAGSRGFASLGKYRELIIAVGFFLLFDLGVLVLNFYTSFQIAEDAVGINLAGRQRMLSQRTAKALLSVEAAKIKGAPATSELEELRNAVKLFDVSLKGFQNGATVPGGNGKPVFLPAAQGDKAADILKKAQDIWTPYQEKLAPVLAGTATEVELQAAADFAKANNLKMLALMNELTTALEAVASDRASVLRMVQTGGIVLALLNFAFILFKFLRRLNTSDAAIEAATEENREILHSVREGLFLLTPEYTLGSQLSRSSHDLFGKTLAPGQNFFDVLTTLVSEKALTDARNYVGLLFSPHVKEQLIQGINPLSEVELTVKNRLGQDTPRFLSFHFNRVQDGAAVRHLLVTVQDITQKVDLQAKLSGERHRSQKELSMMLKAFETDPAMMRAFVERAEASLLEVNDLLRSTSSAASEAQVLKAVDAAYRRIHAIKGDAASLGLEILASLAHQFENELQKLKNSGVATGDALLALPLPLEDLLTKVAAFKSLSQKRGGAATAPVPPPTPQALNASLTQLASDVARDVRKQVNPMVRMSSALDLPAEKMDLVREIAIQLVRNAVVHGIEAPTARATVSKPAEGQVAVNLTRDENGQWLLSVRDDGAGLNAATVRMRLLSLGWYTAEQLLSYSDKQIVAHIFKPGFSTEQAASAHAGRGVGLDLVQANVQRLGARLLLSSIPGQHTEFKITFV